MFTEIEKIILGLYKVKHDIEISNLYLLHSKKYDPILNGVKNLIALACEADFTKKND